MLFSLVKTRRKLEQNKITFPQNSISPESSLVKLSHSLVKSTIKQTHRKIIIIINIEQRLLVANVSWKVEDSLMSWWLCVTGSYTGG